MKVHSSCEIEYLVETHLCELCVILRSRVLRVVMCIIYLSCSGGWAKVKLKLTNHTSMCFHTRRVSISLNCDLEHTRTNARPLRRQPPPHNSLRTPNFNKSSSGSTSSPTNVKLTLNMHKLRCSPTTSVWTNERPVYHAACKDEYRP